MFAEIKLDTPQVKWVNYAPVLMYIYVCVYIHVFMYKSFKIKL